MRKNSILECPIVNLPKMRNLLLLAIGWHFLPNISFAQVENLSKDTSNQIDVPETVITATKTFKLQKDAALIVNVLTSKDLSDLQACNLSESLKFQPGLRMETDCQTCNYTQLRMNGLQGGYSQILVNGRPIFGPMLGLYGLEQLPVNMIERIEIIKGGGSSLYGTSAIGGTVNVITKLPKNNEVVLNSFLQNILGRANDLNLNGNATFVNTEKNAGVNFFFAKRNRDFWDANADNFSEIPKIENTSFGFNSFFQFSKNQKLEFALSHIQEYRFGGEMTEKPAFLALQAEERKHATWFGNIDYQINFEEKKSSLILYTAFQDTKKKHYTGIRPDDAQELEDHLASPPYGSALARTVQTGFQFNYQLPKFWIGKNILTVGSEYIFDEIFDEIESYQFLVQQETQDWGTFLQSDWALTSKINVLSGLRIDFHSLLQKPVLAPRIAFQYKFKPTFSFRLSYGEGFRAPQAFDTDLHMAFAGGGVSRIQLHPNLKQESSKSLSASISYDKIKKKWIAGFTLEGFYNHLQNVFVLENIGKDPFGEIFEKRNAQGAQVQGITLELRANYNKKIELETGYTIQKNTFEKPVAYFQEMTPTSSFLRTPAEYGFANFNLSLTKKWKFNLNSVYTGKMLIAHLGGAENFPVDQLVTSPRFLEMNFKVAYTFAIQKMGYTLELYGGIKNLLNQYQADFDIGKNRDSNYIYGPSLPRTFFFGIKFKL